MNAILEFWQSLGDWQKLVYLSFPLVAWAIRVPVGKLLLHVLNSFLNSLGLKPGEKLQASMAPALQVIFVSFGVLLSNNYLAPPEPYFGIVRNLLVSACVLATFSVAHQMCEFIPQLIRQRHQRRMRQQSTLALRISQFLVVFLGIATVLKVWGIDVGPALTGMGVVGAAVALAAQDSVKNLLGGLNNAAERRFKEGDLIRVDGVVEGYVESVDLRSTKIRRLDTAPVHVPNSALADSAVINFGRRPHRRIDWKVSLKYGTPNRVLRSIRARIETYIDQSGLFTELDATGRYVRVYALNDYSVDLLVLCYTRSTDYGEFLEANEALALAILEIVEDEGVEIALPSRSIYIGDNDNEQKPDESSV